MSINFLLSQLLSRTDFKFILKEATEGQFALYFRVVLDIVAIEPRGSA